MLVRFSSIRRNEIATCRDSERAAALNRGFPALMPGMMKDIQSVRPARAAIAVVLAFSAAPLLAQEMSAQPDPVVQVPASPPATSVPAQAQGEVVAPTFTPNQPMVQPTASVEDRLNASIAVSEAEASAAPVAKKSTLKSQAPASRAPASRATAAAPEAQPALPKAVVTDEQPAPSAVTPAPVAPPVVAEAPAANPAPAQQASTPAVPDAGILAAIGGGVLLMAGLAGVAFARRRKNDSLDENGAYVVPAAEPVIVPPMPAQPIMETPISPVQPARTDTAMTHLSGDERLHAMVAAPPSTENPFRTHKKRTTRAKFLLAQQERGVQKPYVAREMATPSVTQPQPQQIQAVYRFGSDKGRKPSLRPRTS